MPNGEWTLGELGRRMDHLEDQHANEIADLREEMRWTRRLLLGVLASAIFASLISATIGLIRGP